MRERISLSFYGRSVFKGKRLERTIAKGAVSFQEDPGETRSWDWRSEESAGSSELLAVKFKKQDMVLLLPSTDRQERGGLATSAPHRRLGLFLADRLLLFRKMGI